MGDFYQSEPTLPENLYLSDPLLHSYLKFRLPTDVFAAVSEDVKRFGARAATDVLALGRSAEIQKPRHVPFTPWGEREDKIEVSAAWDRLHAVAAEEGLIAIAYERKHREYSRLHQFAKLYLYHPSSAFYSCPLAMTDGAARAIELFGDDSLKKNAFANLKSRDPKSFWTSGQWMTERAGGSDVGGTSTVAEFVDGQWLLTGEKWFTSATTSQMTLTLARPSGEQPGTKGLAMFYIQVHDESGQLQNIEIGRLKDKLGTDALPTAELKLRKTRAVMIGAKGEGVKRISTLLNITRLHNSICATAQIRRALDLAVSYASKREAFGKKLIEHPLHVETLASVQVDFEACFHLVMHLALLLGKEETGEATETESALLRVLTPVAKLWTAKKSLSCVSECLEAFGGAGYIEDTGLPRLLRDAQVFSIWEGTTNVLALDVLRAVGKGDILTPLFSDISARLNAIDSSLAEGTRLVTTALETVQNDFNRLKTEDRDYSEASARGLAFNLAHLYAASLLLEFAAATKTRAAVAVALRFSAQTLTRFEPSPEFREDSYKILQR